MRAVVTCLNLTNDLTEIDFQFQGKTHKVLCLGQDWDIKAAEKTLNDIFQDMERLYGLNCNCPSSALDTSTWLLMGALNLAHRVVCLERKATLQTRDMENPLSRLLDSIPDDVIPDDPITDFSLPVSAE